MHVSNFLDSEIHVLWKRGKRKQFFLVLLSWIFRYDDDPFFFVYRKAVGISSLYGSSVNEVWFDRGKMKNKIHKKKRLVQRTCKPRGTAAMVILIRRWIYLYVREEGKGERESGKSERLRVEREGWTGVEGTRTIAYNAIYYTGPPAPEISIEPWLRAMRRGEIGDSPWNTGWFRTCRRIYPKLLSTISWESATTY